MLINNRSGNTYAPYRYAQRTANRLQSRDVANPNEEQDPSTQSPLQTAITNQPPPAQTTTPAPTQQSGTGKPWEQPNASKYAPRVGQYNGQNYLFEHGNKRLLQGDANDPNSEYSQATAYQNKFWEQNPTGFQAGVGPQSNAEYRAPAASYDGGTATQGRFAGFNFGREQNMNNSAKDTFAAAAQQATWMPQTKEDAAKWFAEFIQPELEAYGYKVHAIEGDKAFVSTRENPNGEWVDFLQNAGGDNPMLAWQSEAAGTGGAAASALQSAIAPTQDTAISKPYSDSSTGMDPMEAMMKDPRWRAILQQLGIQV